MILRKFYIKKLGVFLIFSKNDGIRFYGSELWCSTYRITAMKQFANLYKVFKSPLVGK